MTHIKTAVIVLITAMVLSLVLTYASIISIVSFTQENTQRVLDSFIIQNSIYIYASIKNGNDFTGSISKEKFITAFTEDSTLDSAGNYFYNKDSDGNVIYILTMPDTDFTVDNTLNLTCRLKVLFPIYFAGKQVTELIIPVTVTSSYKLK